ncbi:MAG: tetratricopeptide repeat protein [Nitrospirae bacterium]|nr:tetratricopeptide repeat protein [Nitrospirota bacterium]
MKNIQGADKVNAPYKISLLHKPIVHLLLIFIVGLIVYSNTFHVPFQFDDISNIVENPIIKDLQYFSEPSNAKAFPLYNTFKNRFIGYLTFALNYKLHGLDVTGYHAVNLAIHIINALLVYWLVLLTFKAHSSWLMAHSKKINNHGLSTMSYDLSAIIAFFSALLFVSHPIQTQAVTYIVQRFTSLATLFYLLSLVMYVKFRTQNLPTGQAGTEHRACLPDRQAQNTDKRQKIFSLSSVFWYLTSVFSAVLAMKTKEIAFTLPVIIVLYEFFFFSKSQIQPSSSRLTLYALRFLYLTPFLLTLLIIPVSYIGADTSAGDLLSDVSETARLQTDMSRLDYLFTQFRVIVTYIRLLFLPINQNLDYAYPISNSFLNPNVFLSFLFLLVVFCLGIYFLYASRITRYALRIMAFGIFWFFITLFVESSVIPIIDVIFEHRLYLPGIGLIIAFVCFVFFLSSRFKHRLPLATCYLLLTTILVVLSIASYQRNAVWQDAVTLWEDVVRKSPLLSRPHIHLGQALAEKGRWDNAEYHFARAMEFKKSGGLKKHMTIDLLSLNKEDILNFQIARAKKDVENQPSDKSFTHLGFLYLDARQYEQAMGQFEKAIELNPTYIEAHEGMYVSKGMVYTAKGMIKEAINAYRNAIMHNPKDYRVYIFLGILYAKNGQIDEAIEMFEQALIANPSSFEAHKNIGVAYNNKGWTHKAEEHFRRAKQLNPALE